MEKKQPASENVWVRVCECGARDCAKVFASKPLNVNECTINRLYFETHIEEHTV